MCERCADPDSPVRRQSELAQAILGYLVEHPDAEDTLAGIVEWWLLERSIKRSANEAQAALAALVERGWIVVRPERDTGAGAGACYRVDRAKLDQIRAWLQTGEGEL